MKKALLAFGISFALFLSACEWLSNKTEGSTPGFIELYNEEGVNTIIEKGNVCGEVIMNRCYRSVWHDRQTHNAVTSQTFLARLQRAHDRVADDSKDYAGEWEKGTQAELMNSFEKFAHDEGLVIDV